MASRNTSRVARGGDDEKMSFTLANYTQTLSQQSQSSGIDSVIRFVLPEGFSKASCSKTLQRAYQLCVDYDMNAEWVDMKHLLMEKPKVGSIYVCDPFGGKCYDLLLDYYKTSRVARKFMLIGPMCLEYVFTKQSMDAAIEPRGNPCYTMAMRKATVSFTGFSSDQQGEFEEVVRRMNGVVNKNFSAATTHVICAHVLTAKCLAARERSIPLMSIDWVLAVWEDSKTELVDCEDARYAKHECGVFYNVNMTASQVPSAEKNKLEKVIVKGGGIFSRDFKKGTSQILIVPKPSGDKYKYALAWKVPCVTAAWVFASAKAGYLLPREDFDPSVTKPNPNDIMTSTQIEGGRAPGDLNYTNINMNTSGIQNEAEADNRECVGESTNFTNLTVGSAANDTQSRLSPRHSRAASLEYDDDWTVLQRAPKGFIDNIKVYICDFQNSAKIDDLRCIANNSGAECYVNLNPRVTHVIVVKGMISDAEKKTISKMPATPYLLPLQWLVACAKNGGRVDELIYAIDLIPEVSLHESVHNNTGINEVEKKGRKSVFQTHEEMQQLSQRNTSDTSSQNDQNSTMKEADETKVLFTGLQFYVCIDIPQEALEIENAIKINKGDILEDIIPGSSKVDIIIADPIYEDPFVKSSRVFTKFWLADAIEHDSIEISNAPHYPAYPREAGTIKILSGAVVHVSGYGDKQKEYIKRLCSGMGAKVQQVFTKKKQGDTLKTTHLICGETQNPKYKAAKRWNTTAVTMNWVIQCILQGRQLDADDFGLVDNDDFSDTTTVYALTPTSTAKLGKAKNHAANKKTNLDDGVFVKPASKTPKKSTDAQESIDTTPKQNTGSSTGEESPLVHPCLTREASRQLKELARLAIQTPSPPKKPRRPSTPWCEWVKTNDELLKKKTEEVLAHAHAKMANEQPMDREKWNYMLNHITPKSTPKVSMRSGNSDEVVSQNAGKENASKKRREISDDDELNEEDQQSSRKKNKSETSSSEPGSVEGGDDFLNRQKPSSLQPPHKPRESKFDSFYVRDDEEPGDEPLAGAYWDENNDINGLPDQPDKTEEIIAHEHEESCGVTTDESVQETIPRLVALSGFATQDQEEMKRILEHFQVNISTGERLDPQVDAVIARKCARSEKMLCAVAGGIPLVHPRYLKACVDGRRLLPLEDFVWQENEAEVPQEQNYIKVATQWYTEIRENSEAKPFNGVCVWFHGKLPTRAALERLVEIGGGTLATDIVEANLIISDGSSPLSKEQQVLSNKPKYLFDVIMRTAKKPLV